MTSGEAGQDAFAAQVAWAERAVASSARSPLSGRLALHAIVQIDRISDPAFADRSFLAEKGLVTARDFPAFRAALCLCAPVLAPVMALAEGDLRSGRLQVLPVEVASEGHAGLQVADLMVSLYNGGTVPRLMLVLPEETPVLVQDLLQQSIRWWTGALAGAARQAPCRR